ncbi:MAG: hypothetical protein VW907_01005 [Opitutae bacterium]
MLTSNTGNHAPADWLYREKRLLACGTDSSGNNNDWAVYLVSGSTTAPDNQTRLMLIDGYDTVSATNYAVSDPIDFNAIASRGDVVLRVKRSAVVSASATATFYAQSSIYDDWDAHQVGAVTFEPNSASASIGTDNGIQILGQLNANDNWADALPVSCSVKRFMFFNGLISFTGESETSSAAHAYFESGSTSNFASYNYTPTLDIDFSGQTVYDRSFTVSDYVAGRRAALKNTVTVTVNQAPTNGLDVLAFRNTGTAYWYYGHAATSIAGDTLTIDGLSNSTAYRVVPTIVDTATGVTSNTDYADFATDGSGVLTISASDTYDGVSTLYYGGITASAIEVQPSGGGAAVARFLPTTIAASATTGADSVDGNNTWTLTRTFPASSVAYAPSQIIDRDFLHVYEGGPTFNNCPEIEVYSDFSVLLQCRRFWTGTASAGPAFDILRIETDEVAPKGLRIFYDGPAIKATFYDGTNTETVSWTESPAYGSWQWFVVRRDPTNGLSLVPPGSYSASNLVSDSEITATASATSLLTLPTSVMKLGQDDGDGTFNARFGLSEFAYFDRKLTDAEIVLLSMQIS